LKTPSLQTWIAIGGYDFSNPKAATHTPWYIVFAKVILNSSALQHQLMSI
jgi:hypothetical protein